MNYAIVAFAVVILISVIQWVVDGRKNYKGPQIDVGAMINGEVEGLNVIPTNESSGTGVGKEKK